ncbi:TonB-dependent receptor [Altererythrobacter aerius]|uniref:TonB-dependent receptor n=1 Tax=Tsuneonella aeria TaxID=1837929 RepID=A0A6I4TEV5_9SPHN|nr:TonB-dependent receptor [Tsuneonella aeria]
MLLAASTLAFPAVPANAAGDQGPDDEPVIVVTGTGLPDTPSTPAYDTQTLDRETLVSTASGRIEDALSAVGGFQQFRRSDSRSSNPSAQGVTLRALGGNASSRAQILLDGVPMADPFFGYIPFSAIVPERLGSARVTRGGGSGPFGSGALAGTIELSSADAGELGLFDGRALANHRGETEIGATLVPRLGAGYVAVSGRWDRGQGFFTTPAEQRVPATARAAYDAWSAQVRAVAPLAPDIELQARVLAYRDDRTLRFRGADTGMEGHDGSLRIVGRGRWQFDVVGYVQARNFTNTVISSTLFVPTLDQRNTPATGIGGKIELRPPTPGNHVLRLGLDYRRASGELYEEAISVVTGAVTQSRNAGGTTSDFGLFVENDVTLGNLVLTGGVRADRWDIRDGFYTARAPSGDVIAADRYPDRAGWDLSLRGGAVWQAGNDLQFRAAAYTGLRLPTLNELYRPFTVVRLTTRANASLRNERLEGYEAGLDWTVLPGVSLALTAFDNTVKNAVANVTIGPDLRQRRNIDAIRARGIEANAALSFGRFELAGSVGLTDAEARGSGVAAALDGRRPAQTPRWTAGATASWRPADGALVSLTMRHVGLQFEDDLESDRLPAVTTFDAFARVPIGGGLAVILRAENLADAAIVTRNQGGSIDLGTPRTVWAGLALRL